MDKAGSVTAAARSAVKTGLFRKTKGGGIPAAVNLKELLINFSF
jgi:hypothetical protein